MASIAKLSLLSSPLTTFKTSFLPKSPSSLSHTIASPKKSTTLGLKVHAQLGNIQLIFIPKLLRIEIINLVLINMVLLLYICIIRWSR
jgi:hypothetical protein